MACGIHVLDWLGRRASRFVPALCLLATGRTNLCSTSSLTAACGQTTLSSLGFDRSRNLREGLLQARQRNSWWCIDLAICQPCATGISFVRVLRWSSTATLEVSLKSPHWYRCCKEWLRSRHFHLMECGGTEPSPDGSASGHTLTTHNLRRGRKTTNPWDRLVSLRRFEVISIGLESGNHLRLRTAVHSSKSGVSLWWFA